MRQRRRRENACWRLLCCLCNSIIEAEKGERSPPRAPLRTIKRPSKPQQPQPSFNRPSPTLPDFRPPLVDFEEDGPPANFSANGPQEQRAQPNYFGPSPGLDGFRPPDTGPSERPNVNVHDADGPIVLPMVPPVVQDSFAETRPATYPGNGPPLFSGNGPMYPPSVQDLEEDTRPPLFSGNGPSERPNVNVHDADGPIVLPMVPPVVQDSFAETSPATYPGNGPGAQFAGPTERPEVMPGGGPSYGGPFVPRFSPPDVD
ncbi:uncharacterized protein A4U43_C01F32600 [Asparagus officinalis]|uniref:Uncharacterized protein n=1 Tax=Asparagus officinalis TaxID=4686 RepID=A0A5P1FXB1_ASPOF|nr:non-classical arabinogalactan protein 31-like [Asparagus officinalis]ONK81760.1 uncharacterized protein A4U43_C01F32600 [Asparagus officinalis]